MASITATSGPAALVLLVAVLVIGCSSCSFVVVVGDKEGAAETNSDPSWTEWAKEKLSQGLSFKETTAKEDGYGYDVASDKAGGAAKEEKASQRAYGEEAKEKLDEAKEKVSQKAEEEAKKGFEEAKQAASEMGKMAVEEAKKKEAEAEEKLRWAKEKAKEGYDAGKAKVGETLETAKHTIASNYELVKDTVTGTTTRDDEL